MAEMRELERCATCGEAVSAAAQTCSFCGRNPQSSHGAPTPTRDLKSALQQWSRSVGGPKTLPDYVTSVEVRDQVVHRLALKVARREVFERTEATFGPPKQPATAPETLDPFAHTSQSLREASEHTKTCGTCSGNGRLACGACTASGSVQCSECRGTGTRFQPYKRKAGGRYVKCKTCSKRGVVPCSACSGTGLVSCASCRGSGRHLVWLDFREKTRWVIALEPEHPFVESHPWLGFQRFIQPHELDSFQVNQHEESTSSALSAYHSQGEPLFQSALATIDARQDRVLERQYLELFSVRRDAAYRLCRTDGIVSFVGHHLAGATDAAALRPIVRHNRLWLLLGTIFIVLGGLMLASLRGEGDYYRRSNTVLTGLWIVATVLGLVFIGALLRGRPQSMPAFLSHRVQRSRAFDRGIGMAALLALLALPIFSALNRPTAREVSALLGSGDVEHARVAIDAMKARTRADEHVNELEDAVLLLEARKQPVAARLSILDAVGARGGTKAGEAAQQARAERLSQLRSYIAAGQPHKAVTTAMEWFGPDLKRDPDIAQVVANAYDDEVAHCADSVCRVVAARNADLSAPNQTRASRVAFEEQALTKTLSTTWDPRADTPTNTAAARRALAVAERAQALLAEDTRIQTMSQLAATRFRESLRAVRLLGSTTSVLEDVFAAHAELSDGNTRFNVEDLAVFPTFDRSDKVKGLYVVGASPAARTIHGTQWTADRLIAQTLGKTAVLPLPSSDSATLTRAVVGGVPILARWNRRELWELRIGDAEP